MLSVQAYVDDTTLVGDAQNTQWIQEVAQCYDDVRTAGFVVDSHSCYRSISSSTMRFGPTTISSAQLLQDWPAMVNSPAYATATAAIQATLRRGYNTLVVRMTILPSILILSKDMKLFMVVMLILLAPFPQSSVRARVSLTLSLTFQ